RNGSVYKDVIVAHMLVMSTATGSNSRVALTAMSPGEPLNTKPKTSLWRSRIQDIPAQLVLQSWVNIQLHWSGWTVWTVSRVGSMRVSPPAVRRMTDLWLRG